MTRAEHGRRFPRWLAAALAFAVMAGWAFADARIPYDDRPPLLVAEEVPTGSEPASRLQDVGVAGGEGSDALDVVLRADGGLPYQVFELSGPDRLVVDLPGVSSSELNGLRREVEQLGLVRVRVGQFRSEPVPVARVVLDMTEPLEWAIDRIEQGVRVRVAAERAALQPAASGQMAASETTAASIEPVPAEAPETLAEQQPDTAPAPIQPAAAEEPQTASETLAEQQPDTEPAPSQPAAAEEPQAASETTAASIEPAAAEAPETVAEQQPDTEPAAAEAPELVAEREPKPSESMTEPEASEPMIPRSAPSPAAATIAREQAAPQPEPAQADSQPQPEPVAQTIPTRAQAPEPAADSQAPETPSASEPAETGFSEPAQEPAGTSEQAAELTAGLAEDKAGRTSASPPVEAEEVSDEVAEDPWADSEIAAAIDEASSETRTPREPAGVARPALPGGNADIRAAVPLPDAKTKTIDDSRRVYTGERIDLQLVDADIKQVFGMFHEISGLNFVLDPAVGGLVTIAVNDVPWDQALDLILKNNGLDMVLEGNVVRIAPIQKLAQEAQARKRLHEAKELEEPPVTITRTLSYAKAEQVERVINQAIISDKGDVMIDERTNTLVIRDVPARIKAVDGLLETLDAETPQVMIEARIVEISRDFVKDLGIRWGVSAIADPALGTETNLDFPHRARGDFDLNLPANPAASSLGFSFGNVLDSFTLDIVLDALETEGYARRLSSPKIATQNNELAEIEQGVRIPVVSTTATEIDVRFVSASLLLRCTPQITADGTVILEVEVENNSPDFVNTVGDVPAINTQRAQTKVLINDGGTTVIGGIFTVNEGESETGVPWLRNIPGLGWLFRSRNIQTRNRELLIFITPRIIKAS